MSPRLRAWFAFAAMFTFILATLGAAFELSQFLRARGFLWSTVQLLSAAAALAFGYLLVAGAGIRDPKVLLRGAVPAALYVAAMITMRSSPSERFHFLEYGVLYVLALRAVSIDAPGPAAYPLAAVVTALAGWADEAVQALWPTRYFDWGDVRMNAVAAALAGLVCAAFFGRQPRLARFEALPPPRSA